MSFKPYQRITQYLFTDITGRRGDGITLPTFNIEEIVEFLINLDYKIVIFKGVKAEDFYRNEEDIHSKTFGFGTFEAETILAVKNEGELPKSGTDLDSKECNELFIINVFNKEIKKKLLSV